LGNADRRASGATAIGAGYISWQGAPRRVGWAAAIVGWNFAARAEIRCGIRCLWLRKATP
jgi:hypothetical protein